MILAGVTIVTLTGDNGLLTKAKSSVDKYSDGEIEEQIKLAYLDYKMTKFIGTPIDIEIKLKEIFGVNNVSEVSISDKIILATIKNEKYYYNINTEKFYIDKFNYGDKTRITIGPGEDISIGTEIFQVISNTNGKILAIPYYNLVTVTGEVKQGPAIDGISTEVLSTFSTEFYCNSNEDEIDMSDPRNNVQQYIIKYKSTLEKLNVNSVQVRAAKYSELFDKGMSNIKRNPGQTGTFWLGSSYSNNHDIYCIIANGRYGCNDYGGINGLFGVRPVIVID